jgi:hypothetical protein
VRGKKSESSGALRRPKPPILNVDEIVPQGGPISAAGRAG